MGDAQVAMAALALRRVPQCAAQESVGQSRRSHQAATPRPERRRCASASPTPARNAPAALAGPSARVPPLERARPLLERHFAKQSATPGRQMEARAGEELCEASRRGPRRHSASAALRRALHHGTLHVIADEQHLGVTLLSSGAVSGGAVVGRLRGSLRLGLSAAALRRGARSGAFRDHGGRLDEARPPCRREGPLALLPAAVPCDNRAKAGAAGTGGRCVVPVIAAGLLRGGLARGAVAVGRCNAPAGTMSATGRVDLGLP
mmetsp:Transcript_80028/g.224627  ORF Transcript_80028/g.224627 Transcript_80028/m.224627 type:complete len:262 (+) Transcript_80028:173-958(+)